MSSEVLEKDTEIHFPHFTLLKASAGSGKTHTIAKRYVQFLLSDRIQKNSLRNLLAITFSNNAAKEMKARILQWLKYIYFNENDKTNEISQIVSVEKEKLKSRSEILIDSILSNYTDFQIRTIDSFMTTVFKSSAIDLGFNPDFDILMSNDSLMEYAFNLFLRRVRKDTDEGILLDEVVRIINENRRGDSPFLWEPSRKILEEIKGIYRKLPHTDRKNNTKQYLSDINNIKNDIKKNLKDIEDLIQESGLSGNQNSSYKNILKFVKQERFADLIGKTLKNVPVMKPKKDAHRENEYYKKISIEWNKLADMISAFTIYYAKTYYAPYIKIFDSFIGTIERIKRREGKVFIEDINSRLSDLICSETVPDIYYRLGETIFHYLIDEFQDTSHIQWKNLYPLTENSLSQGGSLFCVGDTKQAIYGFREADFRIMKGVEDTNPFLSAKYYVRELDTNYRSFESILDFNERVFKKTLPESAYKKAGEKRGLIEYQQKVKDEFKDLGYVEVTIHKKDKEDPVERKRINEIIKDLISRGYGYRDIAMLTYKNEDVIKVSTWLNENDIPFISYSSLDIRERKITGEIISLLRFLDAPLDDLSFSTFILGDIFGEQKPVEATSESRYESTPLGRTDPRGDPLPDSYRKTRIGKTEIRGQMRDFIFRNRDNPPLYKAFQNEFDTIWNDCFEGLLKYAGYLPIYDLVSEIFNVFNMFDTFPNEEATFLKILEVIKGFEEAGNNNLRDFLNFVSDGSDESTWNIYVPEDTDAIRIMTIHKAKGLGFPVVILLLYRERVDRGYDYFLLEEKDGILLMKITKKIANSDPFYESLYKERKMAEMANKLNSLYVGFTRAEKEMYIVGIKDEKDRYPFDLLPEEISEQQNLNFGTKHLKQSSQKKESEKSLSIHHYNRKLRLTSGPFVLPGCDERARGEFIHRILYFIDYIDDNLNERIEEIIEMLRTETILDHPEDLIKKTIVDFLHAENILEYFIKKPGRVIANEEGFSDNKGNLFRMDRVILDIDKITVIDYKTGHEKKEEYISQIKNYLKLLKDIYQKEESEGIIAYIDLKEIEHFT